MLSKCLHLWPRATQQGAREVEPRILAQRLGGAYKRRHVLGDVIIRASCFNSRRRAIVHDARVVSAALLVVKEDPVRTLECLEALLRSHDARILIRVLDPRLLPIRLGDHLRARVARNSQLLVEGRLIAR